MPALVKPPTMKDVALIAGVSTQTVSAVINGKPGITRATTARVQAAVEQLKYQPYSVARSLRTGQTRVLAFIVSDIANPSFATMVSAIEDYVRRAGYNLVLYNTHDNVERESSYVQTAAQRWLDGALLVSADDQMTSLEAFEQAGIPTVAIDRIPQRYNGPAVTLDNVTAGRLAAEHLLALGHRRVAHIPGPLRLRLARDRLAGFKDAILAGGGQVVEPIGSANCSAAGNWECESGYQATLELLERGAQVTGIFAANDRMAIGAMRALSEAGLRVPEEMSVVGLDDIEVAAYQCPPLTTVRQSFAELATRAIELLIANVQERPLPEQQVLIRPELVVRQSTATIAVK